MRKLSKARRLWLALLVISIFALTMQEANAASTNGTIQVNVNTSSYYVKDNSGSIIKPNPAPPAMPTNILFFTSSPAPTATTSGIPAANIVASETTSSDPCKYDIVGADGTGIYILAKTSDHYGISNQGYYYNTASGTKQLAGIALSASNPQVYELSFQTDWQMATPYKPTAVSVSESQQRVGETTQTKLTLAISQTPSQGTAPDQRVVTGYKYFIAKSGDTTAPTSMTDAGTPISLDGPVIVTSGNSGINITSGTTNYLSGGTAYNIVVWATNYWTSDTDNSQTSLTNKLSKSWTTLSGGAAGPVTKTWTLSFNVKGVNTISLPFASVTSTINSKPAGAIGTFTVGDLIAEINNQIKAGGGQVSVFGWYDAVNQKQVGFSSLTYDTNGAIVAASSAPVGGAVITAPLTADTPYQVTVTKAGSFTLTGTK